MILSCDVSHDRRAMWWYYQCKQATFGWLACVPSSVRHPTCDGDEENDDVLSLSAAVDLWPLQQLSLTAQFLKLIIWSNFLFFCNNFFSPKKSSSKEKKFRFYFFFFHTKKCCPDPIRPQTCREMWSLSHPCCLTPCCACKWVVALYSGLWLFDRWRAAKATAAWIGFLPSFLICM